MVNFFVERGAFEEIGPFQQLFLMGAYGYVLLSASGIISRGSEMLLSLYGPGIIGGLLIPMLGALPDSAIILVSGLGNGTKDEIQDELQIGVGTLAGSTIMLLTIPWALSVWLGRRDLDHATGEAAFEFHKGRRRPKLTHFSWTSNVVTTEPNVPFFAKIMMASALSYLVIQLPAFFYNHDKNAASEEAPYAVVGLVISVLAFVAYLGYQLIDARQGELISERHREAERLRWKHSLADKFEHVSAFEEVFERFDRDRNGHLDRVELTEALRTLGFNADRKATGDIMREMDTDGDGLINQGEFTSVIAQWFGVAAERRIQELGGGESRSPPVPAAAAVVTATTVAGAPVVARSSRESDRDISLTTLDSREDIPPFEEPLLSSAHDEARHEERSPTLAPLDPHAEARSDRENEEEAHEEYLELTDAQLRRKAFGMLLVGTLLVTLFSDPMVEAIGAFGDSIGVSPFYISFVVTPLASNASEVISCLVFARKRTSHSISLSFSTLYGAATMNSTMGLAIFMALMFFRRLKWSFSAEVLAILLVTFVVGINGQRRTVTLWQAALVLSMFPFSLLFVFLLENVAGLT